MYMCCPSTAVMYEVLVRGNSTLQFGTAAERAYPIEVLATQVGTRRGQHVGALHAVGVRVPHARARREDGGDKSPGGDAMMAAIQAANER